MQLSPVKWGGVEGGQYDSLEPSRVPKNAWSRALNFLPYARRMNVRGGSAPFGKTTPTVSDPIACIATTNLEAAPAGYEKWALLVVGRTGDCALVNPAGKWSPKLTQLPGGILPNDEMPWKLIQRGGSVFSARRNSGGLKRIAGDEWTNAGHPAPALAPTLTTLSGSGSLSNAAYRVCTTFYSSEDDHEGNPSPTATATPNANGRIQIDATETPAGDVHYSHRRFYASQPGGSTMYLIATVPKATTQYIMVANPTSSTTAPSRMGQPSTDGIWFEIWNERGWVLTKKALLYSDFGLEEGYSAVQDLPFNPDDNDENVVCYGWGNYLVVAKRRAMVLLTGVDRKSFEQRLWTEMAGCVAPHSMRDCEGTLVWLSEDGFCSAAPMEAPKLISSTTVARALSRMDRSRMDLVVADTIPEFNLYVAAFPRAGENSWGGVAYNWKDGTWSEFEFPVRPRFLYTGFDSTGSVRVFAILESSAQPWVVFEGATDDGAEIEASLLSGAPDTGATHLAGLRTVSLLSAPTRGSLTVNVFRDGNTAESIASRTFSLGARMGWKTVALSPRKLGSELQAELIYRGRDPFWISDMAWDVVQTDLQRGWL